MISVLTTILRILLRAGPVGISTWVPVCSLTGSPACIPPLESLSSAAAAAASFAVSSPIPEGGTSVAGSCSWGSIPGLRISNELRRLGVIVTISFSMTLASKPKVIRSSVLILSGSTLTGVLGSDFLFWTSLYCLIFAASSLSSCWRRAFSCIQILEGTLSSPWFSFPAPGLVTTLFGVTVFWTMSWTCKQESYIF